MQNYVVLSTPVTVDFTSSRLFIASLILASDYITYYFVFIIYFVIYQAFLVLANPEDACSPIEPPPRNVTNFTKHWAVLIKRSNCTYEDKVLSAQIAKFDLAVVYNNESNELGMIYSSLYYYLIHGYLFILYVIILQ